MNSFLKSIVRQTPTHLANPTSTIEKVESDTGPTANHTNIDELIDLELNDESSGFFLELSKVETDIKPTQPDQTEFTLEYVDTTLEVFSKKQSASLELKTHMNNQAGLIDLDSHTQTTSDTNQSPVLSIIGASAELQILDSTNQLNFAEKIPKNSTNPELAPFSPAQTAKVPLAIGTTENSTAIKAVVNNDPANLLSSVSNSQSHISEPLKGVETAAIKDYTAEVPSAPLTDLPTKIIPEGPTNLGPLTHTNSVALAKSAPTHALSTHALMSQSSVTHHPAVQTVAQTFATVQETQSGITVRLNPPEMGRVFVDFQFSADRGLTAIIRSDVPETAALMKHNADFLQETLKDSGFNSVTLSFEQNDGSKRDSPDFDRNHKSSTFYQFVPNGGEVQRDNADPIPRHLMTSTSAIDLKL
jgi:hypothetical protein